MEASVNELSQKLDDVDREEAGETTTAAKPTKKKPTKKKAAKKKAASRKGVKKSAEASRPEGDPVWMVRYLKGSTPTTTPNPFFVQAESRDDAWRQFCDANEVAYNTPGARIIRQATEPELDNLHEAESLDEE